jgi:hypothetical protein
LSLDFSLSVHRRASPLLSSDGNEAEPNATEFACAT